MFCRKIRCTIESKAPFVISNRDAKYFYGSMNQSEMDVVSDYIRYLFTIVISHFQNNPSSPSDYDRL